MFITIDFNTEMPSPSSDEWRPYCAKHCIKGGKKQETRPKAVSVSER